MTITDEEFELLSKTSKGKKRKGAPTTPAALEAFITQPLLAVVAGPTVDYFDRQPLTRPVFVSWVKRMFADESAKFSDEEIGDFAQHYMDADRTVADTIKMVGLHMKDRLDKRDAGAPHHDDHTGKALAEG